MHAADAPLMSVCSPAAARIRHVSTVRVVIASGQEVASPLMSSAMLLLCTTVRVIHAVLLHTFFNPDEYWQSLEVAHQLTFGYVS